MEINHQAIVTELWGKIRNAIDGKIASAAGHLAEVIQVADQKIAEAASHAADALKAKEDAENLAGGAPVEHEHISEDITDSVYNLGTPESADKLVKTDPNGRVFYSRTPTNLNEVVNMGYLSDQDYLDASDIADTPSPGKVPAYTNDSHLYVSLNPTDLGHAVSKQYVDMRGPEIEFGYELPSQPDPQVLYLIYE